MEPIRTERSASGLGATRQDRSEPASEAIWSWRAGGVETGPERSAVCARRQGMVRAGIALAVAALLALWKPVLGAVAGGVALVLLTLALASPGGLSRRVEGWIATFARAAGTAVSLVTLTVLHVLVLTPLGLMLRATGQLRIERSPEPDAASYWRTPDGTGSDPARHDRQF